MLYVDYFNVLQPLLSGKTIILYFTGGEKEGREIDAVSNRTGTYIWAAVSLLLSMNPYCSQWCKKVLKIVLRKKFGE